jgi:hypothetical protein
MRRDILRWDDSSLMREMMNKMIKNRVDDKIAFKHMPNNDPDRKRGQSTSKNGGNTSGTRPLSEPTTSAINKKSINYRIKKKVMKR